MKRMFILVFACVALASVSGCGDGTNGASVGPPAPQATSPTPAPPAPKAKGKPLPKVVYPGNPAARPDR